MMSDDNTPRWTGLRRFLGRMSGRRRSPQHAPKHTGTQESRDNLDASCPTRHRCDVGGGLMTVLLVTAACLLGMCSPAAACSSRATPRPRPPAPTQRPNVTFHTYVCPPAYATWYCLNGATCFTVKIGESLLYNCECADGYMGPRCEYKDLDGSYLPSQRRFMLETASIASGATIAALLVVVLCAVAYVHYRRRAKEAEMNAADAEPPPVHRPASQDSVDGLVGPPARPFAAAARSSHHRQPTFGSRAPSWKRPHQQQQQLVRAHQQTVTLLPQPQSTDTSMAVGP